MRNSLELTEMQVRTEIGNNNVNINCYVNVGVVRTDGGISESKYCWFSLGFFM